MVKVSILIAIYNGADKLDALITSLQTQTLPDIEMVFVDDASTDASVDLLQGYAKEDARVKVVSLAENRGTVYARKAGVEAASGEYIMFLDQDDGLDPSACEALYRNIQEKNVDILHYRSTVSSTEEISDSHHRAQENLLKPYDGFLYGEDVFWGCFDTNGKNPWNLYTWNLWNKIYRTELCKRAMHDCAEDYVINGDDVYVYMLIAFYATSYYGDARGACYHHYSFGTGLMGTHTLSMKHFYRICRRVVGFENEKKFLEEKGGPEKYERALSVDFSRVMTGIIERWMSRVGIEDRPAGFDMMIDHLSAAEVVSGISRNLGSSRDIVLASIDGAEAIAVRKDAVRTIGVYIPWNRTKAGAIGAEQLQKWTDEGYKVILFIDESTTSLSLDYPMVMLPPSRTVPFYKFPVMDRMLALEKALKVHEIDAFVIAGYNYTTRLEDMILVKTQGIPVVLDASELASCLGTEEKENISYFRNMRELSFVDAALTNDPAAYEVIESFGLAVMDTRNMNGIFPLALTSKKNAESTVYRQRRMLHQLFETLTLFSEDESVQRAFKIEAVRELFVKSGISGKLKLLVKLVLRPFGIKKNLYAEPYNHGHQLQQLIAWCEQTARRMEK